MRTSQVTKGEQFISQLLTMLVKYFSSPHVDVNDICHIRYSGQLHNHLLEHWFQVKVRIHT